MTDAELIELVRTRAPQELTPAEAAELRERLKESPELRQAVAERPEVERHLADTTPAPPPPRGKYRWAVAALLLGAGLAVGFVLRFGGAGGDGKPPGDTTATGTSTAEA